MKRLTGDYTGLENTEILFSGCIVSDLLSHVMAKGKPGQLWLTHHGHPNIVAVAVLKELAAIIVVADIKPDPETIDKAKEQGITLLTTSKEAYDVAIEIATL